MWVRYVVWEDPLEEGMATHSSVLAWRIPWTEEPGGLQSIGSQRVGHEQSDLAGTHLSEITVTSKLLLATQCRADFQNFHCPPWLLMLSLIEMQSQCHITLS